MYRREAAACGEFVRLLGADREKKWVTAERAKVAARMKDIVDGWGGALAGENRMWWTSSKRGDERGTAFVQCRAQDTQWCHLS